MSTLAAIALGAVLGVLFSESIRAAYKKYVAPKLDELNRGS